MFCAFSSWMIGLAKFDLEAPNRLLLLPDDLNGAEVVAFGLAVFCSGSGLKCFSSCTGFEVTKNITEVNYKSIQYDFLHNFFLVHTLAEYFGCVCRFLQR